MKSLWKWLAIASVIISAGIATQAQTEPNLEMGFKPYGSFDGSNIDSVNLTNGNLVLHIPMMFHYPQRGGKLDMNWVLTANAAQWGVHCFTPPNSNPNCSWGLPSGTSAIIASLGTGVGLDYSLNLAVHRTRQISSQQSTSGETVFGYYLNTADGATHWMHDTSGSNTVLDAIDTTGWHLEVSGADSYGNPTTGVLTDRHGSHYQLNNFAGPSSSNRCDPTTGCELITTYNEFAFASQVTDSNGNIINFYIPSQSNGTDTLGRTLLPAGAISSANTTDYSGCVSSGLPLSSATTYVYAGPNGATYQVKACYANVSLQTAFAQSAVTEYQNSGASTTIPELVTLTLPDGTAWVLSYDSYGNISSLGLPKGGSINYAWTTVPAVNCGGATKLARAVATRTVHDANGHAFIWSYTWGSMANGSMTNSVTDPLDNDTVHVFTALNGSVCRFYETSTLTYQGTQPSRQLLKRVDTSYSSTNISADGATNANSLGNVVPTSIQTTIYPSGKVSLVTKTYDAGLGAGAPIFGNVVTGKEYDWGTGSAGALLRETDTTYVWQSDARYLTAHLLDLPASVVVKDGGGNKAAETDSTYDEPAYLSSSTISTQHGPAPNPAPVRGNLTTTGRWLNTAGGFVTSHTNWYDTGEVRQSIDPLGHPTTHSYDAVYAGGYSTSTCNALSQCVSGTYDFTTGLLTSFTNANATQQASGNTPGDSAHTISYSYDSLSRMTSAMFPPDPGNGNGQAQTGFSYPSATERDAAKSITSTLTDHASVLLDGLGRPIQTQHQTPSGTAKVDTTYDGLDHAATVSNPYFSTSDSIYGNTQTQYDALGRVTSTTKQDSSVSSASYNIVTSIGGTGDCSISTDEAGKQRGSCTDALGRLVEVDEPTGNPVQAQNYVTLQSDSNFVVYNQAGNALWQSGTAGLNAPSIYMQDDGNLVLYTLRWMAGTYTTPVAGAYPQSACSIGTYLTRGEFLPSGKCITSPHGEYFLLMNTDGNLFIYDWYRAVGTWGPGTQGHPGAYAVFQTDGNFVVYDANGTTVLWQSGTSGTNAERLDLLDDSRLMIWKSVWSSGTSNGQFGGTAIAHPACDIGNGTGWTGVVGAGSCLVSPNGHFEMLMQNDGNLAIYDRSVNPPVGLWSVGTIISPADPGVAMRTLYTYDALGNLLCVEQHGSASTGTGCSAPASSDATSPWRVRRFSYDSLSRLLTATNPESGQISYSYDADGNMLQKTSPAPNQTGAVTQTISYCYDALHRVVAKGYGALSCPIAPGSAAVSYVYDHGTNGIGHLSSLTDQAGSASYSYDVLGRLSSEQRTIAGVSKSMSYAYNLDGSLKSLTYPSGAIITYAPDSAGRMLSAVDSGNNINYVTSATYDAGNALTGFVSGQSNSFAGITNSFSFNKRLQPVNMSASAPSQTVFSIGYDFHFGNGNNGNVYGITNYKDANRNQTFTYDALNRLATAQNAGTDCTVHLPDGHTEYWGNSYSYDPWGNLLQKKVTKCSAENMNISADGHNWIHTITGADYTYDAAGNMTYNATSGQGYTYDQENRITGLSGYAYTYDIDGNRVMKTTTATPATGTLYWYMTPGIVGESDLSGAINSEYVFFGGERVARRDTNSGVFYYFSDHLKTAAVETDASGNIKDESDFYPWGGELQFTNSNDNHYKFTGKERDQESQLDYFGARYYGNGLGRFLTADWAAKATAVPYAEFSDPQSLNLYAYVRNVPTVRFDLDGHQQREKPAEEEIREEEAENKELKEASERIRESEAKEQEVRHERADEDTLKENKDGWDGKDGVCHSGPLEREDLGNVRNPIQEKLDKINPFKPSVKEGIYEGPDAKAPGKTYVGQSGDIPSRLSQHQSSGRFPAGTKVSTTEVTGGKTAREVAEHTRIQQLGGVRSQPGSQTSNVRNPIGPNRQHLLNEDDK